MVRNWLQWEVRRRLDEQAEVLPNMNKRPTQMPTTENVFHYFEAVNVVLILRDGCVVDRHVSGMGEAAAKALEILGIDPAIFTTQRNSGLAWGGTAK